MKTITSTALFVLLACSLQLASAGSGLRVLSLSGTRAANSSSVTFTVTYEATTEPQVRWLIGYPQKALQATTTFSQRQGNSQVVVPMDPSQSYFYMYLEMGQLRGQFFQFTIDKLLAPDTTLSQVLNLAELDIQPGDDLSYTSGNNAVVTMTVDSTNGLNAKHHRGLYPFGTYMDSSGQLKMGEVFSFLRQSRTKSGTKKITTTTFKTSKQPINGYFGFISSGSFTRSSDNLISSYTEYMVVSVHADTFPGPFPPGFNQVTVEDMEYEVTNRTGCIPGVTWRCGFTCEAVANNVTAITARREGSNEVVTTEQETTMHTYYTLKVKVLLDIDTDFAGDYACYVTLGNGQQVKSDVMTVEKVDKEVRVVNVDRETLTNGTIKTTCTVSGSDPQVFLSWDSNNVAPIQEDGTYVLSVTTETTSGDDPLTIVTMLRKDTQFRPMVCIVKNVASNDKDYFYG